MEGFRKDPRHAVGVLARLVPTHGQATLWITTAQEGMGARKPLDSMASRIEGLRETFVPFCMARDVVSFVVLQTYAPQAIDQLNAMRDFLPEASGDAVIRQQATTALDQVGNKAVA